MNSLRYHLQGLLGRPVSNIRKDVKRPHVSPPKPLEPFPNDFPYELLIYIVALAAQANTSTALALSTVSWSCHRIAEPGLFREICIGLKHGSTHMLKHLISPECPPRLLRARGFIISVRVARGGRIGRDVLTGLLTHCPNLELINPGKIYPKFWTLPPPPHLLTLHLESCKDLDWDSVDCTTSPFAAQITHLSVRKMTSNSLRLLPNFSNLTHFFVGYQEGPWGVEPWEILVPNAPQIQIVLVHLNFFLPRNDPTTERQIVKIIGNVGFCSSLFTRRVRGEPVDMDPRFVAVVSETLKNDWDDWSEEFVIFIPQGTQVHEWLDDGWKQGEKIVEKLRVRKSDW
ncbi:hypothetical protein DL96DRAFT_1639349 [Flagelloscypha sp. PMI_526]|nr:hypothetical protein DL96DRAFT_1639349 [Flagelloscypha sp. PMI_526]